MTPDIKVQLEQGMEFLAQENYRDAQKIYQSILAEDPNHIIALRAMGHIALEVENLEAAEDYFQRALALNPKQYQVWLKLGHVCSKLRKAKQSLHAYKNAITLDPGQSTGYLKLGSTLLVTGQKDEAIAMLEKAFLLDKDSPMAFRLIASTTRLEAKSPLVAEAKKRMEDPDLSSFAKANLSYGLAYVYEQSDDEKFLYHLKSANQLQKESAPPWRAVFERNARVLKEIFTEATFNKTPGAETKEYTPIFIVGMPRSGTTLTEQIITSHPKVFGADEVDYMTMFIVNGVAVMTKKPYLDGINDLGLEQLRELSRNYQQRMQKIAPGFEFITDKYLSNFLNIGLIKLIMPWAKVIGLWRHPMDNALSIYRNYFLALFPYCYDLEDMAHYYHIYHQMMEFWEELLPGFVCNVNYEDLVNNFEDEARRIIDFCGLEWDNACLEPHKNKREVMSLSQVQVRQPIYKSSIGKWKKFEAELAPFARILEAAGIDPKGPGR